MIKSDNDSRRSFLKYGASLVTASSLAGCLGGDGGSDGGDSGDGGSDGGDGGSQPTEQPMQYPERDIRQIVPYGTGGGFDTWARGVAQFWPDEMGADINIVVENVSGGGGVRGVLETWNADPDGYTLGMVSTSSMTLEEIVGDPGFTLSEFQWIGRTALSTNAFIVHPDMPWDSVTDIDREVTFGSIGPDASATVTWEITVQELGLPETNYVHGLSGLGEVLTSVIRGDVEAGIVVPSSPQVVEAASAGDIKVLLTYTVDPLSGYEQAENLSDIDRRDLTATAGTQRAFTGPPDLPENIRQFLENSLVGLKDNEDMLAWVAENGYEQNFSPVGKDAVLEWNASAKKLYSEYTDMFAD